MGSGQDVLPTLAVLALFGCLPPLLCLLACRRRVLRLRAKGHAPGWVLGAMLFSVAALLLNLGLLGVSAAMLGDAPDWTRLQVAMLLVGWICFWLWVVVLMTTRTRHRRALY